MERYIKKSDLESEIEKLIRKNELYLDDNVSDSVRFQKTGAYSVLNNLLHFLDTLEVKEVDEQKEKVENIKKYCPFREVVCSKYQDHPLKCSGACAFVSDRITLEKKYLCDIQNVPVDEEKLRNERRNTV